MHWTSKQNWKLERGGAKTVKILRKKDLNKNSILSQIKSQV